MEYKVNTLLPIQFEKVENPPYLNDSRFQAVRVYLAHEKENFNGSYFDLSVLENMGKKMAGVPIVGYISANNVNENDFNGHEYRVVIQDGDVSTEYLGRAYGCVLSNDDITIVDRMHEDGKMRKYLCATGVLWKMFTDCIDIFDRDGTKGHSMELQEDSISGKFEKDGYYHFTDATVRALCILGEGLYPAMSNSVIEKFSKEDIDKSIQELLQEVQESIKQFSLSNQPSNTPEVDDINNQEGGNSLVNEKLELVAKYNLTVEQLEFSIDDLSLEDLETKLKEFTATKPNEDDKPTTEFSATYRQKRDALSNALDRKIEKDADGNIIYEEYTWVEDFDDTYVYVEKNVWTADNYDCKHGRYTYVFDETNLTATITSEFEEMIQVWLTLEENKKLQDERANATAEFEKLKGDFNEYKNNYSTHNEEVIRLKNFETQKLAEERDVQETEIFSQYEEKLGEVAEFKALKESAKNFSIEDLEKELALLYVKKTANFSTNKKDKGIKIHVPKSEDDDSPYEGIHQKYLKKN
jgi:hypothetical protein